MFGDGKVWLVGCPHCLKVLGANFEVNLPKPTMDNGHTHE